MPDLYEDYLYNRNDGGALSTELRTVLKEIMTRYRAKGYEFSEISHVVIRETVSLESEERLQEAVNRRRKERNGGI
jgi:molybdenum-dependent DNA-binding transcriptional regulator ModE